MLRLLSGRAHEVLTGVVVIRAGVESAAVVATRVPFRPITAAELTWYVASGEPHDKARGLRRSGAGGRVCRVGGGILIPTSSAFRSLRCETLLGAADWHRAASDGGNGHPPEPFDRTRA